MKTADLTKRVLAVVLLGMCLSYFVYCGIMLYANKVIPFSDIQGNMDIAKQRMSVLNAANVFGGISSSIAMIGFIIVCILYARSAERYKWTDILCGALITAAAGNLPWLVFSLIDRANYKNYRDPVLTLTFYIAAFILAFIAIHLIKVLRGSKHR